MRLRWDEAAAPGQIATIAERIDEAGFCRIDDFLDADELAALAALAAVESSHAGGEYVERAGLDRFAGSLWERMARHPALGALAAALYRHATGSAAPEQDFFQMFRCLKGESSRRHAFCFHFDSYVLAILLPIVIPAEGRRGDLILFPAARPLRRAYWRNVFDKLVADRRPMQRLYRWRAGRPGSRAVRVGLVPGSAVLFWGYRSLHAHEPCAVDRLRATALLHFGNPHRGAGALRSAPPG